MTLAGQAPAGHTPAQIRVGNRRLLELADILDVADALHRKRGEPTYDQSVEQHDCGTPACAWGHYAYSTAERRRKFVLPSLYSLKPTANFNDSQKEFRLSVEEKNELFHTYGCGCAGTAKQAARYIRAFVKRRERALSRATGSQP